MDLLTCFGSERPIFVDGGALCREVAWNAYIDWSCGGQWLQCIYLAERILAGLVAKGFRIHLFFFEEELGGLSTKQRLLAQLMSEHVRRASLKGFGVQHHVLSGSFLHTISFLDLVRATDPSCILTDMNRSYPQDSLEDSRFRARSCAFVRFLWAATSLYVVDLEGLRTDLARLRCDVIGFSATRRPGPVSFSQELVSLLSLECKIEAKAAWAPQVSGSLRLRLCLVALKDLLQEASAMGARLVRRGLGHRSLDGDASLTGALYPCCAGPAFAVERRRLLGQVAPQHDPWACKPPGGSPYKTLM